MNLGGKASLSSQPPAHICTEWQVATPHLGVALTVVGGRVGRTGESRGTDAETTLSGAMHVGSPRVSVTDLLWQEVRDRMHRRQRVDGELLGEGSWSPGGRGLCWKEREV